jgi:hypothetical protein
MAGLLAIGSTYLPRLPIHLRETFEKCLFSKGLLMNSGIQRLSFPITAAGPHRIFTGFPFMPVRATIKLTNFSVFYLDNCDCIVKAIISENNKNSLY